MTLHIIGGGIAGLAAACAATAAGRHVIVHESAQQPGGRCRSFFSESLGTVIDNGAHVILGCNDSALDYVSRIGAAESLVPLAGGIAFADITAGTRWTLRPASVPWWIFDAMRRVPGSRAADYFAAWRLLFAGQRMTVASVLPPSLLYERLWRPLCEAALNTHPEQASARLMASVVRRMFRHGGESSRVFMARDSLSATFIEPAVRFITAGGGELRTNALCEGIATADGRVTALKFRQGAVALAAEDHVIAALPPWAPLMHHLCADATQMEASAIVNVHFRLFEPATAPAMTGLTGGTAQWLFQRGDVATVTVSAANALMDLEAAEIAALLWRDVSALLGANAMPPYHVIKERRATLVHTPEQESLRPGPATAWRNMVLAGDWTATGLPCTIDGAVASGRAAWAATRL